MSKYKIKISGMTCRSCGKLVEMLLDDAKFENINIDTLESIGTFDSDNSQEEVNEKLKLVFSEAPKYQFDDLENIS